MPNKILLTFLFLLLTKHLAFSQQGNGKKIYADYHGTRYSREHDGMLGRWSFYADTEQSKTNIKRLSYNADNILKNGKNDIAAVAFPLAGMHSNLDPNFIEYQILTAKAAKIDGFFIEWGYQEHESTLLLEAMQKVAAKYNFEIGVNWCDGWLYYDWITKVKPDIKTRYDKTNHFKTSFQYLVNHVFDTKTAPIVNGKPVFYLFGGGITPEEYSSVMTPNSINLPKGVQYPQILRRVAEWGKIENNTYIPAEMGEEARSWEKLGMSLTAWIPARVRPMDKKFPLWDNYGTKEDAINFMRPFKTQVWDIPKPINSIRSGFVTPGMDNRGCAGWGRGHFFCIPREKGKTYDELWELNLQSKDSLDMVFIASWSDYTEGHEIEPTVENGYTALLSTLKYSSIFKNEQANNKGLKLPLQLFKLRQKSSFLKKSNIDTQEFNKELNKIAVLLSNGEYDKASLLLKTAKKEANKKENSLKIDSYHISKDLIVNGKKQNGIYNIKSKTYIKIADNILNKLIKNHYTGYISFDYLDENVEKIELLSHTKKTANYAVVAEIRTNKSNTWKTAKVELFDTNIDLTKKFNSSSNFIFKGAGKVKNIKFDYKVYSKE